MCIIDGSWHVLCREIQVLNRRVMQIIAGFRPNLYGVRIRGLKH